MTSPEILHGVCADNAIGGQKRVVQQTPTFRSSDASPFAVTELRNLVDFNESDSNGIVHARDLRCVCACRKIGHHGTVSTTCGEAECTYRCCDALNLSWVRICAPTCV